MSESFDPYLKWFGIPLRDHPIHHYRLLAIEVFEADAEVIENAADQRMAHLKRFNTGKHSALAEKLLNEVAAARVCLLSPAKKQKYDEELRQRLSGQGSAAEVAAGVATPPPPPVAAAEPAGDSFLTQFESTPGTTLRPVHVAPKKTKTKTKTPWGVILAVVAGLAAVVLIIVWTTPKGQDASPRQVVVGPAPSVPDHRPPPNKAPEQPDHGPEKTVAAPVKAGPAEEHVAEPPKVPAANPKIDRPVPAPETQGNDHPVEPVAPPDQPETPAPEPAKPPKENDTAPEKPSGLGAEKTEEEPVQPGGEDNEPKKPGPKPAAAPKKIPPPDEAARKKAERTVRDRYLNHVLDLESNQEKIALAERMVSETEHNTFFSPATQLVAMEEAAKLDREAGQIGKAIDILDKISDSYDIDVAAMKADMVQSWADELTKALGPGGSKKITPQVQAAGRNLLEVCRKLTADALAKGDVETALRFLNLAQPAANRLHDPKMKSVIQSSIKDVEKLKERIPEVQSAIAALRDKPDDPETNLTVGSWYCLVTGDWEKGLPYLAKGSDADMAEAAKQDLAKPDKSADQLTAGNLWWSLAKKYSGLEASRLKNRAAHWYTLALPQLSGAQASEVHKRLDSLGVSAGQYALEFDGQSSYVVIHNLLYPGTLPITIEAVVKIDPDGNGGRSILFGNGDRTGLSLGRNGNTWFFRVDMLVGVRLNNINSVVSGGGGGRQWTHVAAVYDGHQMRLYVDGRRIDSKWLNGQHKPGDMPFVLGALPAGGNKGNIGNGFKGLVRALRVSKAARYDADFTPPTQLGSDPATVAVFNFSEGRGDRLAGGKKIFGDIHGAEWVRLGDADAR